VNTAIPGGFTLSTFTQAKLDALEDAIAEGALTVKYADKQITYRSLAEMMQIRDLMRKELGVTKSGNRRVYAKFSKGLNSCE
jgi:hypothetical protein